MHLIRVFSLGWIVLGFFLVDWKEQCAMSETQKDISDWARAFACELKPGKVQVPVLFSSPPPSTCHFNLRLCLPVLVLTTIDLVSRINPQQAVCCSLESPYLSHVYSSMSTTIKIKDSLIRSLWSHVCIK